MRGADNCDIDGNGTLEILILTIDHGLDIFTVEGASCNCVPHNADEDVYCGLWPTGRAIICAMAAFPEHE